MIGTRMLKYHVVAPACNMLKGVFATFLISVCSTVLVHSQFVYEPRNRSVNRKFIPPTKRI